MRILNSRKCIVTNELKDKAELIRIVKTKEGKIIINSSAKGRGAYISKNINNPEIILKNRVLNKSFKMQIPKPIYDELIIYIKESKGE